MGMFCKKCCYDLSHCETYECPECGRAFDPLLSETYRQDGRNWYRFIPPKWMRVTFLLAVLLVTLPILAPRDTEADARYSHRTSPLGILQTTRSQLELFRNQHGRRATLIEIQDRQSAMYTRQPGPNGEQLGPYLQQPPVNILNRSNRVVSFDQATLQDGWVYNERTGEFRAICDKWTAKKRNFDTENDMFIVE